MSTRVLLGDTSTLQGGPDTCAGHLTHHHVSPPARQIRSIVLIQRGPLESMCHCQVQTHSCRLSPMFGGLRANWRGSILRRPATLGHEVPPPITELLPSLTALHVKAAPYKNRRLQVLQTQGHLFFVAVFLEVAKYKNCSL